MILYRIILKQQNVLGRVITLQVLSHVGSRRSTVSGSAQNTPPFLIFLMDVILSCYYMQLPWSPPPPWLPWKMLNGKIKQKAQIIFWCQEEELFWCLNTDAFAFNYITATWYVYMTVTDRDLSPVMFTFSTCFLFSRWKSGPASIEQPLLVSSGNSKCGNWSEGFQAIGLAGKSIKTC